MTTQTGLAATCFIIALTSAGCGRSSQADAGELIAAYTRAACVPPRAAAPSGPDATRTWNETFDLGSGVAVKVDASCPGVGSVRGKYSDEPEPRSIAGDDRSMSPCDLRIDWMQMRLYVRSESTARTALYEYDLQARRSPRQSAVDPGILPPRCDAGTSK